jgi:vacuolar-type H+-ATPase subunit C/Vma6
MLTERHYMKNGELIIAVNRIVDGNSLSHWEGELLYNDESVSQVTGTNYYEVVETLLDYAQSEDSVIDKEWFNY